MNCAKHGTHACITTVQNLNSYADNNDLPGLETKLTELVKGFCGKERNVALKINENLTQEDT